jgi:hypothetical protein
MESNGSEQRLEAGKPDGPPANLDPRLTQLLCAALQTIAVEQNRQSGPAPNEKKKEKKPSALWSQRWSIFGALLVTGASVASLFVYHQLGEQMAANRSEAGSIRRELGQYRPQFVRKDEFSSRNLAIHALLQDTQSKTKAAMDANRERFQEHKQGLRDYSLQVKELGGEAKRFEERLAVREKREGIVPPTVPDNQPKGQ